MHFQGIWWGMIIGVSLQTVTLIILTARTNWDAEVNKILLFFFFLLKYHFILNYHMNFIK